jgi:hypothetical protein
MAHMINRFLARNQKFPLSIAANVAKSVACKPAFAAASSGANETNPPRAFGTYPHCGHVQSPANLVAQFGQLFIWMSGDTAKNTHEMEDFGPNLSAIRR